MPADQPIRVAIVDGAFTRELRRSVLRPNLVADAPLPGDERRDLVHFAALEGDQVMSTCYLYVEPCPWKPAPGAAWHLRQMATAEGQRGKGFGAAVINAAMDHVAGAGGGILWCQAREGAIDFYRQAGFTGDGEIFTDEVHIIPHLHMWRMVDGAVTGTVA